MASAVADGAKAKGADVTVFTASQFNASKLDAFDAVAFGCPAMGAEVLEESEFAPMFEDCKAKLSGKNRAFRLIRLGRRRMDAHMGRKLRRCGLCFRRRLCYLQ